jgi:glycine betaine/choline ABC-type transport system substrate-binding protein
MQYLYQIKPILNFKIKIMYNLLTNKSMNYMQIYGTDAESDIIILQT